MPDTVINDLTRVFLLDGRAGPLTVVTYEGRFRVTNTAFPFGSPEAIRNPDPGSRGKFVTVGQIPGELGDPTMDLEGRYDINNLSKFLALGRGGCQADLQIHIGQCGHPQDFQGGWDKILVLEGGRPTTWSVADLGALEPSDRGVVNETVPFQGEDLYELVHQGFAAQAESIIELEILGVITCDSKTCGGACGAATSGCDHVFAVASAGAASPGILAQVIFSANGGGTWGDTVISTLGATEDPDDILCASPNVLVLSEDSESLHYAPIDDVLDGAETWTEMATGFVVGGGPRAGVAVHARHIWIVGAGGFIYLSTDPTSSVTVQDDGTVTSEDLNAISAIDEDRAVAVGNTGAIVQTINGGETWSLVTDPTGGVNINAVEMIDEATWFIGDASGNLFYTVDSGQNFTAISFPGSGAGVIRDIEFRNRTVGYMAHDDATPLARLLKTIDGGQSWYIAPEGQGSMPVGDHFTSIAVCEDINTVFAGGLGGDATDGILVKGSGG